MKFVFRQTPIAQQRPRFGKKGVYNPQSNLKLNLKWDAAHQMRLQSAERVLESPISFKMSVHVPMPKTWSNKRKKERFGLSVTTKPDLDNYLKWYADVLTGIAYSDDNLVSNIICEKIYDYEGYVQIQIKPMTTKEEAHIFGKMAVEMHEALDEIYDKVNFILKDKNFPYREALSQIKQTCLDAGLFEIYQD